MVHFGGLDSFRHRVTCRILARELNLLLREGERRRYGCELHASR